MELARLTNLGNLTLANLLDIEYNYDENSSQKREKLAKLWASEQEMNLFERLFTFYHDEKSNIFIAKEGGSYLLKGRIRKYEPQLNNVDKLIQRYIELGLVRIVDDSRTLRDIDKDIKRDEYANPIKHVSNVMIELTGLCNLYCKHCFRSGSREGEYGLTVEEIKKALVPLLRAGIRRIGFTGGEATQRKDDLLELIDYSSQFLVLKGVPLEEKLKYWYGTSDATVDGLLKTKDFVKLRKKLKTQLRISKDQLPENVYNISKENTPEDVEELLRKQADKYLEEVKNPPIYDINLDSIVLYTNGFFDNQRELVKTLKSYGNVIIQTSLDSLDEETTDRNRGKKGVFAKVKSLTEICKEEDVRLSIVFHEMGGTKTKKDQKNLKYFLNMAKVSLINRIFQLGNAPQNNFDHMNENGSNNYIGALSSSKKHGDGWCKGFTRPVSLHIRPTGKVGNCTRAYAVPEEFGDIKSSSIADIVNGIQNTRIYQMFKDGSIERYQHELDKSLFSKTFNKSCEIVILTAAYILTKERLMRKGVENPVQMANLEVARTYKFIN
jgi:molybdenum cofactor biosynthesis enzyme MoaA